MYAFVYKIKQKLKSNLRKDGKAEEEITQKDNACNQIDNVRVKLLRNNSQVDRP